MDEVTYKAKSMIPEPMFRITVYNNAESKKKFQELLPLVEDSTDFIVDLKNGTSHKIYVTIGGETTDNFKKIKKYFYGREKSL